MNKLRLSLCAIGAYLVLVAAFGVLGSGPATGQKGSPPGPDVRVVNRTNEPVPVTLQGTGQFNGDVNVVNTPTVKVDTGTPLPVTDVDNPARQPFAHRFLFLIPAGQGSDTETMTVPGGKRLVIETVSARISVSPGQSVDFVMFPTTNGVANAPYVFPPELIGTFNGLDRFQVCQSVRIYCDPGTDLTVTVQKSVLSGGAGGELSISGYLVDVP